MALGKFFARFRNNSVAKSTAVKPKQNWAVFSRENFGVISIDRSYSQLFHYGYVNYMHVTYSFGDEQITDVHMPLPEIQKLFFDTEDRITDLAGVLKVASVVSPRTRRVWFVCNSAETMVNCRYELSKLEQIKTVVEHDSAGTLSVLLPNQVESQIAQNSQIMSTLLENGDDGSAVRQVRHWILHGDDWNPHQLIKELTRLGYSILQSEGDRTVFEKLTALQIEEVDDETIVLNQLAKKHGVKYDGWETAVVAARNSVH